MQEGQPRLWNVSSLFQPNESDGNANFIRAVVYQHGYGKKKFAYFFSLWRKLSRSDPLTLTTVLAPGSTLPLAAALLPPY